MKTEETGIQKAQTHEEARKLLDEAWKRASKVYKEAKEQADILYGEAKKMAADKEARKRADQAHKEAIEEAKKVRDAITNVALAVFSEFWKEQERDIQAAKVRVKERGELAQKVYKDARKQADVDHKEALGKAADSDARKEADAIRKEADKRARKDYDEEMKQ